MRAVISAAAFAAVASGACGDNLAPPSIQWRDGPALPGGRLEPGVIAAGDALWVIGGFDDGIDVVASAWVLPAASSAWQDAPAAPEALTHMNLASVDGAILLLGGLRGRDYSPTGASWALDAGASTWRRLAAMPAGQERGAAAVIVDGGRVVVAGGADLRAAVASVWAYDVAGDRWSRLPDLPSPRSHAVGAVAADGALLVVGGTATLDASQPLADVLALAPGASAWTARAPMPTARGGCAAAVIDGGLICAGGEAGGSALRTAERYDLVDDAWTELEPMPRARAGTGGAAIAGALWVPGGAHRLRFEPSRAVEIWMP